MYGKSDAHPLGTWNHRWSCKEWKLDLGLLVLTGKSSLCNQGWVVWELLRYSPRDYPPGLNLPALVFELLYFPNRHKAWVDLSDLKSLPCSPFYGGCLKLQRLVPHCTGGMALLVLWFPQGKWVLQNKNPSDSGDFVHRRVLLKTIADKKLHSPACFCRDQKWLGWLSELPWEQILLPSIYNSVSNPTGALYTSLKCLSYRDIQEQYNAMEIANRVLRCIRSIPTALQRAGGWGAQLLSGGFLLAGPTQFIHWGTWQLKKCHRGAYNRELKSSQSDSTFFFFCFHF